MVVSPSIRTLQAPKGKRSHVNESAEKWFILTAYTDSTHLLSDHSKGKIGNTFA